MTLRPSLLVLQTRRSDLCHFNPTHDCLLVAAPGQQQLVCLARVILHRPRIVCLDECTASVDPATAALMQDLLRAELPRATVLQARGPALSPWQGLS